MPGSQARGQDPDQEDQAGGQDRRRPGGLPGQADGCNTPGEDAQQGSGLLRGGILLAPLLPPDQRCQDRSGDETGPHEDQKQAPEGEGGQRNTRPDQPGVGVGGDEPGESPQQKQDEPGGQPEDQAGHGTAARER